MDERWERTAKCLDAEGIDRTYLPWLFEYGVNEHASPQLQELQQDISDLPECPEAKVWSLKKYLTYLASVEDAPAPEEVSTTSMPELGELTDADLQLLTVTTLGHKALAAIG